MGCRKIACIYMAKLMSRGTEAGFLELAGTEILTMMLGKIAEKGKNSVSFTVNRENAHPPPFVHQPLKNEGDW